VEASMKRGVVSVAAAAALLAAVSAGATQNHPAKAKRYLVNFVRAFQECPNSFPLPPLMAHDPPLAFPACAPASTATTLSFGPKGFGQAAGVLRLNKAKQATDMKVTAKFVDVRNGDDGTGSPFEGIVTVSTSVRVTDDLCAGSLCTMIDIPFPMPVPCGSAASPALTPGKCATKTTLNTLVPGGLPPGHNTTVAFQLGFVVLAGPDVVFQQGIQAP
jgi:hypothetical protein